MAGTREPNLVMAVVWAIVFVNLFMRALGVVTWALVRWLG